MAAVEALSPTWQWPADILAFAAQQKVDAYLDPVLAGLRKVYPMARSILVKLEDDPEIRDDWHIVFEVRVRKSDVPDYRAATKAWHRELFRICPAPLVCVFRHALLRLDS